MLYLFNNLEKLGTQIAKFQTKHPGGAVYRFDADTFLTERARFEELLASGDDLFGEKSLIVLDEVSELDETEEERIKISGAKVLWFRPELIKKAEFNFFSLADALIARDRAALWLGYQQALETGVSAEEVFWRAVVWPVKKLLQSNTRHYSRLELATLSSRLVRLWHDTKREEGRDFNLELERLLLTI